MVTHPATERRAPPLRGLYAITPDWTDTARLAAAVRDACAGGAALVQYRNKQADAALRAAQAERLAAVCREAGVPLIVNDDAALARAVGAAGAHLGREDGALQAARAALGDEALLGVSCYDRIALADAAAAAGADYIAFGAVYASGTKPAAVRAPLALLAEGARRTGLPVAAIGGITLARVPELIAAGADMVAVVSDLFDAPDISARAASYAALFASVESQS